MPRPTTKESLLVLGNEQFENLWKLVDSMSEEEQNALFLFEDRDKVLRDVLVHLHEWHNMAVLWHKIGTIEGGMPVVPGEGYTWKTLPALNMKIWEKYQSVDLAKAKKLLKESHKKVVALIESHTDQELFERKVYKWTKTSTLGAYFVSATSSHYDWAMKKLKKHLKLYRATK